MSSPIRLARELRQEMTPEEKELWCFLRNRNFYGYKARRQHPIVYKIINKEKHFFIADFYFAEKKLVIELDGNHHLYGDQRAYDEIRDMILTEMQLTILRISNDEIREDIQAVLRKIKNAIK